MYLFLYQNRSEAKQKKISHFFHNFSSPRKKTEQTDKWQSNKRKRKGLFKNIFILQVLTFAEHSTT